MNSLKVSIITPSYNQAQFLEETIQSVLEQEYPNIEYIIIDGGSTDGSVEILRRYSNRLAYWVSEPDRGQADALNKGFARATGDILAWLNSDDLYRKDAISRVVDCLLHQPEADIIYGSCDLVDERSRYIGRLVPPRFELARELTGNLIAQPATFFRRAVLDGIGGFNMEHHHSFDYEFWLKAALAGFRFVFLPPPTIAAFRMWDASKSEGSSLRFVPETLAILEGVFADPRLPPDCRNLKRRAQAGAWRFAAHGSYRSGAITDAWRCVRQMVRLRPGSIGEPDTIMLCIKLLLGTRFSRNMREWRRTLVNFMHKRS